MRNAPQLQIVVAVGLNGAIGRDGELPWRMPGDLAHFKSATTGTPMIMGSRTWRSIGRPLPGRESIVVSRRRNLDLPPEVCRATSPDAALDFARSRAVALGTSAISLIGGAQLFDALMPAVDRVIMTVVELSPPADTFFPALDGEEWREVSHRVPPRHPADDAACIVREYVRR